MDFGLGIGTSDRNQSGSCELQGSNETCIGVRGYLRRSEQVPERGRVVCTPIVFTWEFNIHLRDAVQYINNPEALKIGSDYPQDPRHGTGIS